jgi:hypothetical protein
MNINKDIYTLISKNDTLCNNRGAGIKKEKENEVKRLEELIDTIILNHNNSKHCT